MKPISAVMLSLSKHLYRFVESIELLTRERSFDKLSMTGGISL